ncbi:MAG: AbiV family abortive infection protein [Thermodesulfobacteriota bacterium]
MEVRKIKDLCQLKDNDLFEVIAQGLKLIYENAKCIIDGSIFLKQNKRNQGSEILENLGNEEAAKFLILLDAIRCDRKNKDDFSRQLGYFNDHLARNIYALYCDTSPADFREVREIIERAREVYYIDGPEWKNWVFRNIHLSKRESCMYVDYVKSDNKHHWISPNDPPKKDAIYGSLHHSFIFNLINALHTTGCTSSDGLKVVASKWRPIEIKDNMSRGELEDINRDILEELYKRGLLHNVKEEFNILIRYWLYPLYPLDLRVKEMDLKKMQSEADKVSEDFLEREHMPENY